MTDDWLRKATRPVGIARVDATAPNLAQEVAPASRIVDVDNDPVVIAHARALVQSRPEGVVSCLEADAREPAAIHQWRPDQGDPSYPHGMPLYGAVGRKS